MLFRVRQNSAGLAEASTITHYVLHLNYVPNLGRESGIRTGRPDRDQGNGLAPMLLALIRKEARRDGRALWGPTAVVDRGCMIQ